MKSKYIVIGLGVVVGLLIIRAAIPWYDTGNTHQIVSDHYGYKGGVIMNFDNGTETACINEVDGVGVKAVPFGVVMESCQASWFVFLNVFPFQTEGDANLF